jgi:hypothetical protein
MFNSKIIGLNIIIQDLQSQFMKNKILKLNYH